MRHSPFAAHHLGAGFVFFRVNDFHQLRTLLGLCAFLRTGQILHQAQRNGVEGMVVLRQRHREFVEGFHFRLTGNFARAEFFVVGIKYITDETVELLAIVHAEVVRAGLVVHMGAQIIAAVEQAEDGRGGVNQRRQRVAGSKAAGVIGVVGEQRGAIGKHRGEVRVVRVHGEVVGCLLGITKILAVARAGFEA